MKSIALIATLAAVPACFAIDDPNDGAKCLKSTHCDAGESCVGGKCVIVCDLQMDCAEGRYCNPSGLCVPVDTTGTPPVLTAVRGNDAASESRVRDGIIVSGDNLVLASFELRKNDKSYPLATRERSNSRVELTFPVDIRSGEYMLLATNASGEATTGITLTLPEVTPELVLTKLNASTGTVSMDRLPMDLLVSEDELAPYPTRDELTGDMMVGRINQSSSTIAFERLPTTQIVTPTQLTAQLTSYARQADLDGNGLVTRINASSSTLVSARLPSEVVLNGELDTRLQPYATAAYADGRFLTDDDFLPGPWRDVWGASNIEAGPSPTLTGPISGTWTNHHSWPQYRIERNRVCFRGLAQTSGGSTMLTSGTIATFGAGSGLRFSGYPKTAITATGATVMLWGTGEFTYETDGSKGHMVLGGVCFALDE